ncbi:DegT/DnrJ/EryC1/StrS family aminotransferase [Pectinatus sottacetonis]|uniref:DegT/DnrJ/EryC1/StrS family aminotransferase n=1 Tax=Pectinatus sottacetonis TaxID=1002795 RepID=UPI0018C6D1B1|nr:DegT/DnrJ/EryC1/StrS family aminotransferase [Pectinatus sottacetonis]
MKIDLAVLNRQFELYQKEYESAAIKVLRSGWYILGPELEQFENEFKTYIGCEYSVGLNSGLDALTLAVKALGIKAGDEVIVPANTYIATVLSITENGATPIFVEPDIYYNIDAENIERVITAKTKAIMTVHLYGQAAQMDKITQIANKYNLYLLEDCAQSHGAHFDKKMTGSFGDIGCFSFYPTKNLGAFGDSGAIVTDNEKLYKRIKMMRNYGSRIKYHNELEGVNSRLDEVQAALLRVKLEHIKELESERKKIANIYLEEIRNDNIKLPMTRSKSEHVYHQFVIRTEKRDKFKCFLEDKGIKTVIHYPIPPHLSECYRYLGHKKGEYPIAENYADTVLSLPIFNGMTDNEITYIIDTINGYKG